MSRSSASSAPGRRAALADVEPRREWNASNPWCLVHIPTGEKIATPRELPDGSTYMGFGFRLKRDAVVALEALRAPLGGEMEAASDA